MDERSIAAGAPERPIAAPADREVSTDRTAPVATGADGGPLVDPRALTILTTEHWSLLSARSLVYNEAFARGGMFLTFLSASLVALGLIATATKFSPEFRIVAIVLLAFDLFIGAATLGRVSAATGEDVHCLQGMNRIRHAYLEIAPGLAPYFVTSPHDDMAGVFSVYGAPLEITIWASLVHGLTTMPGMIAVIDTGLGAVLVGLLALAATESSIAAIGSGIAAFAIGFAVSILVMNRSIAASARAITPRFPSPPRDD